MDHLLAKSFARALQSITGLRGAALPSGITNEVESLVEFTRHANKLKFEDGHNFFNLPDDYVPFAILWLRGHSEINPEFEVCRDQGQLAQFRLDNHLLLGASRELATYTSSIEVVVDESFPNHAGQNGRLSLEKLAESALCEVLDGLSNAGVSTINAKHSAVLAYIFKVLADAHEYTGQLSVDWNAIWFDHVNVGLNQLRNGISRVVHLDVDAYFAEHLYAAFSLPTPENGYDKKYKLNHRSKSAIVNAINSFWISAAEIELSLAMLDNSAVNAGIPGWKHSLSNLDWTLFDATSTSDLSHGSGLLSWAVHEENANNRIQHFSQ